MYSQKWNCVASFPISTFLYLWMIYLFPRSVRLFCCIAHRYMNVGIENEATQFQFWEYLFRIFCTVFAVCSPGFLLFLLLHRDFLHCFLSSLKYFSSYWRCVFSFSSSDHIFIASSLPWSVSLASTLPYVLSSSFPLFLFLLWPYLYCFFSSLKCFPCVYSSLRSVFLIPLFLSLLRP